MLDRPVGTTVTLIGEWFSLDPANMYAWFNGIRADVLTVDSSGYPPNVSVTAQVPPGATTGDVWLTVNAQYTVIARTFTVTSPAPLPPVLTRISPESGEQDAGLLIEGMGFNAETYNNIAWVNGAWAEVITASPTQLLVRVPFTSSGLVIVETGGQASTGLPFTVIPAPSNIQTVEYFGRDLPAPDDRVVYVLDSSESMLVTFGDFVDRDGNLVQGGSEWDLLLDRTIQSISELPPGFSFNIISFAGFDDPVAGDCIPSLVPWQSVSVPATQGSKDAAVAWLQGIVPLGKTGTAWAVAEALSRDPQCRTLILCTDGLWNCPGLQSGAEQLCTMFNANPQKAAIHAFGILVQDRFARVLQEIAKLTGGTFTLIE